MKFSITILALFFTCIFAQAQTEQKPAPPPPVITYRLDMVAKDSFYLIEVQTAQAQSGNARPQVTESPILFKGQGEWDKFLESLRQLSADDRKKAKEISENASKRDALTLTIEALMSQEIAKK
jgi:hypothetical protein